MTTARLALFPKDLALVHHLARLPSAPRGVSLREEDPAAERSWREREELIDAGLAAAAPGRSGGVGKKTARPEPRSRRKSSAGRAAEELRAPHGSLRPRVDTEGRMD